MRKAIVSLSVLATLLVPVAGFATTTYQFRNIHVTNSITPIALPGEQPQQPTITNITLIDSSGKACYTDQHGVLGPNKVLSYQISNKPNDGYCTNISAIQVTLSPINLPNGAGSIQAFGTPNVKIPVTPYSYSSANQNDSLIITTGTAPTYKVASGTISFTPGTLSIPGNGASKNGGIITLVE